MTPDNTLEDSQAQNEGRLDFTDQSRHLESDVFHLLVRWNGSRFYLHEVELVEFLQQQKHEHNQKYYSNIISGLDYKTPSDLWEVSHSKTITHIWNQP